MKKTAVILMIISVVSKIFGFAREVSLSYFFGATNISDAYLISQTIPTVIFAFIGAALGTGFIPIYSDIKSKDDEKKALKFTNNVVNGVLIVCSILILLSLVFTQQIVKLFAVGFEGQTLYLAIKFTRISLLGLYFSGLVYIFNSYLQIKGNFVIPALIPFPMNIIIIASMFFASKINPILLPIGSILAFASQLLFILPYAYKNNYRYKLYFDIKDKSTIALVNIALPAILGISINQLNVLVDRTVASKISEGGISALNYANKLSGFVLGIIVTSLLTVLYPTISKMVSENNIEGLKKSLSESIGIVNLLIFPATVGSMVFAKPIVELLFKRGAFDNTAAILTSQALFYYSVGLVAYGLREVFARAFYSMKDTKTPTINASISLILNIILNLILSRYMGIAGLALATSISAIVCTGLLFVSLKKKIGSLGFREILITSTKIVIASLVMGVFSLLSFNIISIKMSKNLALLIAILVALVVYTIMILVLKIKEVDEIKNKIIQKIRRE